MKSTLSIDCGELNHPCDLLTLKNEPQLRMFIVFASIVVILFLSLYYSFNNSHKRPDTYYGPLDKSIIVGDTYHLAPVTVIKEVIGMNELKYPRFNFHDVHSYYPEVNLKFVSGINSNYLIKVLLNSMPYDVRKNAQKYIADILQFSEINNLDPLWVLSVIWTESHFKSRAKSHVNATGLMQIMPETGKFINVLLKRPTDKNLVSQLLMDPRTNIELGTFYLRRLFKKFNSHMHATIAYNMGPHFVRKSMKNKRPLGVKNLYLNKVNFHYKKLLAALVKVQQNALKEGLSSMLIVTEKPFQISYFLGEDLNMIPAPKYALRHEIFYPKRLVIKSQLL